MKRCPACQRTYDEGQSFCIEDGAVLHFDTGVGSPEPPGVSDPPATEIYHSAPSTGGIEAAPTGNVYAPPSQPGYTPGDWQQYSPPPYSPPVPQPGYGPMAAPPHPSAAKSLDQSLAIAALICGIMSITFMCFGGILGIPAIILGVMARNRVKNEPTRYGGNGLATGGMVCGIISTSFTALYIVVMIIGAISR
jgi:hypothetical protein